MNTIKYRMGWKPDLPDYRDYTIEHQTISPILIKIGISPDQPRSLPANVEF